MLERAKLTAVLLFPLSMVAAVTNVSVETTVTQAVIRYTAPDMNVCQVEVSQDPSYSPVVFDVEHAKFADSDDDNRAGNITKGRSRTFVVGKQTASQATDTKWYSRALQAATLHYYRITCGVDTATGTFKTKNLPWGHSRNHGLTAAGGGAYAYPTIDASDRTQEWIDPKFGTRVRQLADEDDFTLFGSYSIGFDAGHYYSCQSVLYADSSSNNGVFCVARNSMLKQSMYWIDVTSGESRYLGTVLITIAGEFTNRYSIFASATWDKAVAGTYFATVLYNGKYYVCKGVFTGSVDSSAAPNAPYPATWTMLTDDLWGEMETFTAGEAVPFDITQQPSCSWPTGATNNEMTIVCEVGGGDTYAYYAVYDLDTAAVVAAMPGWTRPSRQWCVHHEIYYTHHEGWMVLSIQTEWTGAPHTVTVTGCSGAGCSGGNLITCSRGDETTLTITSAATVPGDPYCANCTAYWQNMPGNPGIEVGDVFRMFDPQEFVKVTAINSQTSITVSRGWGVFLPQAHTLPKDMNTYCGAYDGVDYTRGGTITWDYKNDPNGDALVYNQPGVNPILSHFHVGTGYAAGGHGTYCRITDPGDVPACADQGRADHDMLFEGFTHVGVPGNSWQTHPRAPTDPVPGEDPVHWMVDAYPKDGDTPQAGGNADPEIVTAVSGDLYKLKTYAGDYNPKYFATQAACGSYILENISSAATGDQIGTLAGDNFKYCAVAVGDGPGGSADECRDGAYAGEVYFNCPGGGYDTKSPTQGYCENTNLFVQDTGWTDPGEICFGDLPAVGYTVLQSRMDRDYSHAKSTRQLFYNPLYRAWTVYANARMLPARAEDGSGHWIQTHFTDPDQPGVNRRIPALILAPPEGTDDTVRRDKFIKIPVAIKPPTNLAVDNAIIEFGYDENLRCTTRNEVCVAAASNSPYFWAHEGYSGVSCSSGCKIEIPAISGKVLYYKWKYRDASDVVLAASQTQVLAVP